MLRLVTFLRALWRCIVEHLTRRAMLREILEGQHRTDRHLRHIDDKLDEVIDLLPQMGNAEKLREAVDGLKAKRLALKAAVDNVPT